MYGRRKVKKNEIKETGEKNRKNDENPKKKRVDKCREKKKKVE